VHSRERMVRAIECQGPDRVPMLHVVLPAAATQFGTALVDLLDEYPDDAGSWWRRLAYTDDPGYRAGRYVDEWGCEWENLRSGMMGRVIHHPLADWESWPTYRLPPPPRPEQFAAIQDEIEHSGHAYYVFGSGGVFGNCSLFERMMLLRGYANLMIDLATGDRRAYALRDALLERNLERLKGDIKTGADGIGFGDDWGTQTALMVHPDLWRRFFRPAYRAMFELVRSAGKHVHFHTDGYTYAILGDLIDIGASVLNVQHSVMDIRLLGREFGGKVAFRSDVDCQHVLQHGTRQQVFDHVRLIFDCFAVHRGGLIWHGEIEPDMPFENVRWMLEAFRALGSYC
jgi:uroporphyrinogen decarboxylase